MGSRLKKNFLEGSHMGGGGGRAGPKKYLKI